MNEPNTLEVLAEEARRDFQIPPYFPKEGLLRYAEQGKRRLEELNPGRDIKEDQTFRMLLSNYVYYAYHHKINEWEQNYASIILSWQLGSEVTHD